MPHNPAPPSTFLVTAALGGNGQGNDGAGERQLGGRFSHRGAGERGLPRSVLYWLAKSRKGAGRWC